MLALFAEFTHPCWIGFSEAIAKFFELAIAHFHIPGGFDSPPALLKLDTIGFREMSFGIALQMDSAELDVGIGKEALADGEQTGEVVLNENHHPPKATLNQTPKDGFPVFEIFTTWSGDTTQDTLLAITPQTNSQVDTSGTQFITLAPFDVLAIDKHSQQVRIQRPAVAQFQFLDHSRCHAFQILFRAGQAHLLKCVFGGIDRAARAKQSQQQRLDFLAVTATIVRRQSRRPELSGSSARHANFDRNGSQLKGTIVKTVRLIGGFLF